MLKKTLLVGEGNNKTGIGNHTMAAKNERKVSYQDFYNPDIAALHCHFLATTISVNSSPKCSGNLLSKKLWHKRIKGTSDSKLF